jgi:hypothetical protein
MAVTEQVSRPAPFVEKLGTNLAENVLAQQGVPIVTGGLGSISQLGGESADAFKARQDAAQAFDVRKQSLAGLAPQVAGQDVLQQSAQALALQGAGIDPTTGQKTGLASYEPFLNQAQASTGANAYQQFMSPYQSQVMEASLAEFDRNAQMQQQRISDQAVASGAFGGGREGVVQSEYQLGSDRNRLQLQAGLLNQGFGQAQQAAQQNFANQQGLANLLPGLQGTDISRLGQLGALNQAQTQAGYDATREATRQAAFQPQEQLDRYASQVTGIMGGYPGQTVSTNVPNPTPLQTALGVGTTLAGIYGGLKNPGKVNYNLSN